MNNSKKRMSILIYLTCATCFSASSLLAMNTYSPGLRHRHAQGIRPEVTQVESHQSPVGNAQMPTRTMHIDTKNKNCFTTLPYPLIRLIIRLLPDPDLVNFSRTCRDIHTVCYEEENQRPTFRWATGNIVENQSISDSHKSRWGIGDFHHCGLIATKNTDNIVSVSSFPCAKLLTISNRPPYTFIVDREGRQLLRLDGISHINSVALFADNQFIITGHHDGNVCLWNRNGKLVRQFYSKESAAIAPSIDNSFIAIKPFYTPCRFWQIEEVGPTNTVTAQVTSWFQSWIY